jgi:hypothetical protein
MIVINQFLLIAVLSTNRSLEETITKELIECQGAPVNIGKSNQSHRFTLLLSMYSFLFSFLSLFPPFHTSISSQLTSLRSLLKCIVCICTELLSRIYLTSFPFIKENFMFFINPLLIFISGILYFKKSLSI